MKFNIKGKIDGECMLRANQYVNISKNNKYIMLYATNVVSDLPTVFAVVYIGKKYLL